MEPWRLINTSNILKLQQLYIWWTHTSTEKYWYNRYVRVRSLYQHAKDVSIGAKLFLSADGGIFNNSTLDEQILNRIIVLDFRNSKVTITTLIEELGIDKFELTCARWYMNTTIERY